MLDLKFIRKNPDYVRRQYERLHMETPLDQVISLDEQHRDLLVRLEDLKATRNRVSKEISRERDPEIRQSKIEEMRTVAEEISSLEGRTKETKEKLDQALLRMPNLPDETVPDGASEDENRVVATHGEKREFAFNPKPHWELGVDLDIIDFERGVKVSGSRFYILKGHGARLQRAVIAFMLDLHTQKHGYTEIYPPYMVKEHCMIGTGQLPKFGENLYHDTEDDYYFIPTAEVPVTNMYFDEIIPPGKLPLYYTAFTACFRREKMSAGRDVRGIKRGHQFDKVELVKFVAPESSGEELDKLISDAEDVCRLLKIPYRLVEMCTGDLSFTAAKKVDIEMWAPGCDEWLEVSSCSNFKDFQARRANIRFKRDADAKTEFVHTLNGSGLALPRTLIAIMENYQNEDGSITIPDALIPYMGGIEKIG